MRWSKFIPTALIFLFVAYPALLAPTLLSAILLPLATAGFVYNYRRDVLKKQLKAVIIMPALFGLLLAFLRLMPITVLTIPVLSGLYPFIFLYFVGERESLSERVPLIIAASTWLSIVAGSLASVIPPDKGNLLIALMALAAPLLIAYLGELVAPMPVSVPIRAEGTRAGREGGKVVADW